MKILWWFVNKFTLLLQPQRSLNHLSRKTEGLGPMTSWQPPKGKVPTPISSMRADKHEQRAFKSFSTSFLLSV